MKILMINLPFAGHTNPTLPLTRELVKRGHDVTYVNAEEFRSAIEACGARFVPYNNYPSHPDENRKKKQCFRALFDTVMNLEESFDLLIYEMFFYPGAEIARRLKIPCVRQFSQPAWSEPTWKDAPLKFRISAKLIDVQVLPKRVSGELGLEHRCLKDGIIKDLDIKGDYFFTRPTEEFIRQMKGTPHTREDIQKKIGTLETGAYFAGIDSEDIVSLFF